MYIFICDQLHSKWIIKHKITREVLFTGKYEDCKRWLSDNMQEM